ncbi:FeoB-associated Cys-rich membrane protein [uncultured Bacteroides sp.]|uniref:FeoB-associated Cys-rich membrane protein n=1 Tax=uncultured Bacteroides sp. TaxID=162156 RepID=UPI002AA90B99|nr:FeoB-associated Cys-rich membrane protein [uncultured Bacteroides sp.]
MVQNIITLIIIFSALAYVAFTILRKSEKKNGSGCAGCSGCALKNTVKGEKSGSKSGGCH